MLIRFTRNNIRTVVSLDVIDNFMLRYSNIENTDFFLPEELEAFRKSERVLKVVYIEPLGGVSEITYSVAYMLFTTVEKCTNFLERGLSAGILDLVGTDVCYSSFIKNFDFNFSSTTMIKSLAEAEFIVSEARKIMEENKEVNESKKIKDKKKKKKGGKKK